MVYTKKVKEAVIKKISYIKFIIYSSSKVIWIILDKIMNNIWAIKEIHQIQYINFKNNTIDVPYQLPDREQADI